MKATAFPDFTRPPPALDRQKAAAKMAEKQMCLTKRAYKTHALATSAMLSRRSAINGPSAMRVYRCPHCDMWHLTSKV